MRFLTDSMLGRLTRWLRMLGYDTLQADDVGLEQDREIARMARKQGRVLLTRDKELGRHGTLIKSDDLVEQLRELDEKTGLHLEVEDPRCPLCNTPLRSMTQGEALQAAREMEYVSQYHAEQGAMFWRCPSCDRVYWEGSHWDDIKIKLRRAREPAREPDS